ncbi:hypothetical protein Pogu_0487 [Pyrobaculum oguniense TE7]|uniref:Uncharacterized protein n=1 Tax=Pyrobaculum oguniense (strain DSM 13380 / JCM 10595 / TE7) TaxID=698757 RepID=H6Q7U5_PYROT|nr:hypothetical protein Pogu_0487 [Pyrobaculum oguniense TE7]
MAHCGSALSNWWRRRVVCADGKYAEEALKEAEKLGLRIMSARQ